jgi:hypothetical protein
VVVGRAGKLYVSNAHRMAHARSKGQPEEFVESLGSVSEEEKDLLVDHLAPLTAPEVDPALLEVPDHLLPEDQPEPLVLRALAPDELPRKGVHFVVWGSRVLSDIRARPVVRDLACSEDAWAKHEVLITDWFEYMIVEEDTPGAPSKRRKGPASKERLQRSESYARWRFKGFVCGGVVSL